MDKIYKAKVRQIEMINKLLERENHQVSPDTFDMLWDLDIDELTDVRLQIERETNYKAEA